jgi:hypothetical protein
MLDVGMEMFGISVVLATVNCVKHVSAHQVGREASFLKEVGYEKIDPDDVISFIKPFTVRSRIQCCRQCLDNSPLCVGALHNTEEKKCKLLKRFLSVTNHTKIEWNYFRMKGGLCIFFPLFAFS